MSFYGLTFEKSLKAFSPSDDELIYTRKELEAAVLAEREACAKVCEEGVDTEHPIVKGHIMKNFGISEHLAAAIRARGTA